MPIIRRADREDLEEVIRLRMALLRELQPDACESETNALDLIRQYVTDRLPKGEFLVWFAEEEGQVVGTAGLVFFHRPPLFSYLSTLHAYVLNMYTIPEWRGRGVATMLLQHIIEYVKTTSAGRISLHANEVGRPIYERLGFTASNNEMALTV
ncbi:MAG: GNAT family N-acetyltransferase [Armatimonadetes bacterium]|nr:GNAT family N-acetyltransferase [Armatimonadota bacterium]NIO56795.1 GNAT family N-acetyltransferase [Candidatus Latescibacterota bacterium]NIM24039.1 GNAT family N-acetyltransferase [Armatimonadota bacterium]NIM67889.1 GNAT family N-acetyltransferase [Armatimonadota bacterium]NIM76417.1 GNAT family N-acetyltransferase [Armatimonadota bacterium]